MEANAWFVMTQPLKSGGGGHDPNLYLRRLCRSSKGISGGRGPRTDFGEFQCIQIKIAHFDPEHSFVAYRRVHNLLLLDPTLIL